MAHLIAVESEKLIRALSEKEMVSVIGSWRHEPEKEEPFQEGTCCSSLQHLKPEFVRFKAFKDGADKNTKEALTRVIASRSEVDMREIKAAYHQQDGAKLEDVIARNAHANYWDALLSLLSGKE